MKLDNLDTHLLDGIHHPLFAFDSNGKFIYLNHDWLEILGWSIEEFEGRVYLDCVHPDDQDKTQVVLHSLFSDAVSEVNFVNRFVTNQGDYHTLHWSAKKLQGNLVVGTAGDSTEQLALEMKSKENYALLRHAETMSRVGYWRLDISKNRLFWSDEVFRIHGLDRTVYTPDFHTALAFYTEGERHKVKGLLDTAINAAQDFDFHARIRRPSGEIRHVLCHGEVHLDQNDIPVSLFGIIQDVTEREQLLSQNAMLSVVANTTTTGVVITDSDRKVVWVNDAFTKMSEYTLTEVRGKPLGPFLQGVDTDPETIARIKQRLKSGQNVDVEILNYQKTGTPYWNHLLISPEHIDGKLTHFVGLQHDITKRKIAEMELVKEEKKYRDVVNNAREVIFQLDKEAKWIFLNPFWRQLTGFNRQASLGKSVLEFISPEHKEWVSEYLRKCRNGLYSHFNREIELFDLEGQTKFVEMRIVPMFSAPQKHSGFQGTIVDKTEFREQQRILARTQRIDAIGELVAGICHDFNNLLGIIRGNSDLLDMSIEDTEVRPFIDHIRKASEHGSALTEKLLKSTRKMSSTPSVVNLTSAVNEVIPMLKGSIPNNVNIITRIEEGLACYSNALELQDCLINLVVNAKNALDGSGEIVINAVAQTYFNPERAHVVTKPESAARYIKLSVKDNGCGIEPVLMEDIFKPFFTTRKGIGSGLGLSMVAGFVSRFHYGLTVNSVIAEGTEVSLWIPEEENKATFYSESGPIVVGKVPDNIVIIDDEEMLLEAIVIYMENENVTATAFSDPEMALNYINDHQDRIDVIITDEIMPGSIQGHDIVNHVKRVNSDIKLVLMTGYASSEELEKIDVPVIYKPFSMNQLKKVILEVGDVTHV